MTSQTPQRIPTPGTLSQALVQALMDHGTETVWSDGGQDWTLGRYLEHHQYETDESAVLYCDYCGHPVAPEGVTLTGDAADPRPVNGATRPPCDDSSCVTSPIYYLDRPAHYDGRRQAILPVDARGYIGSVAILSRAACASCGSSPSTTNREGRGVCGTCAHMMDAHGAGLHDAYAEDPCEGAR